MRADRLVATLLLMQARGRVTAAELAAELEISVATARRDLEALSSAGIPVYPQAGRGGGWQLLGEGRTDLSGFTASEARALFLTLGPRAGESDAARSALRKVMRALPVTFRAEAEAAAESVVVEAGGWGASAVRPTAVAVLQAAVVERRVVRFDYAAWGRPARARTVRPLGLVDKGGTWYLVADSAASDTALRSYRVDRMTDAEALDERFEPPAGFDLDAAWSELSAEVGRARTRATATVRVAADVLDEFRAWVGGTELVGGGGQEATPASAEPDGSGRVLVRVTAPSEVALARRLAAWVDGAEVIEPEGVRQRLAAFGARLAETYGAVEPPSSSSTLTTSA
ncbi:helix-turn-helix transcriptional regulator [Agromyces allii]|uniref:WYL domain-containing protein n=1 Tax=Agromyces allii TaxID=393607 RepID=A0ABP5CLH9_9MICO|nr:WYL domain-containing protein [Agromyces allii]